MGNVGLAEAVAEADPGSLEYQTLIAEAPIVNGDSVDPPVTGINPTLFVVTVFMFHHHKINHSFF